MARFDLRGLTMTVPWNLFLLSLGGVVAGLALKCIAVPHGFISGGLFGTALLVFYTSEWLSPAIWYVLINLPIFFIAWRFVGRRFFFYTIYGMVVTALTVQFAPWAFSINNTMLAAIAAGAVYGIGMAIMLRSRGCDGGLTIVGIILNQRFDVKLGMFSLTYNVLLFLSALFDMETDLVLYSMVLVFVQTSIIDYSMRMVTQRKLVFIVSDKAQAISRHIMHSLTRGCTFIPSRGAYTNIERNLIMTVVHNYQLKRLEELVFQEDPHAFLIVESTYDVMGQGFSHIKRYS